MIIYALTKQLRIQAVLVYTLDGIRVLPLAVYTLNSHYQFIFN